MANICVHLFFSILKPLLLLVIIISLLPLIPNIPPTNLKFTSFKAPDPPALTGKLAVNNFLNGGERLFEGEIIGPEGFAILNGELYTTLHGGFVAKISNEITPVVKFGQPCNDRSEEAKCGRPLGIFAGSDNLLYVADAYYGVFKYDVVEKTKEKLFGPEDVVGDRKPKLMNSLAVAADGTIYWSDSTSDVHLQDGVYAILADGSGRLIKYNPKTKKHSVLIDGLVFANGVALAPDESFVLVAETGMSRIHRHWLKGPLAGKNDIFADSLAGMPDNLRAGSDGFLVGLIVASDDVTPALSQVLYPFPYIRKVFATSLALTELLLEKIDSFYPNAVSKQGIYLIGHFETISPLSPLRSTLVVYDTQGNIKDSFHATDGSVQNICDAIAYRGELYLGSPYNSYLGRVKNPEVVARFQKAFPSPPQITVRVKETPKPTTTTAKPTTTTAKPPTTTPKPATTTTAKPTTTSKPPTTTTAKPTTTSKPPTTTTAKPTTTTAKPTTTTAKPSTTTSKPPTTTAKHSTTTTTKPPTTTSKPPSTTTSKSPPPAPKHSKSPSRDANEL